MTDYRYLLLDFDNTLVDFDETERRALTDSVKEFLGISLSPEELTAYHRINDGYWKALERHEITKERLKLLRFRDFLTVLSASRPGPTKAAPEELNRAYVEKLALTVVEYPEAYKALSVLQKQFRLYVITNGAEAVQTGRMSGCSFRNLISGNFISEVYGFSKPDAAFFNPIAEKIGDPDRSRYLVVGDSLTSDMQFAENAGLDACLVTHGRRILKKRTWKYEIRDISELPELLHSSCGQ